jgi:hypothetical protein
MPPIACKKNQYTFKLKIAISLGLKLNDFVYVDFVFVVIWAEIKIS